MKDETQHDNQTCGRGDERVLKKNMNAVLFWSLKHFGILELRIVFQNHEEEKRNQIMSIFNQYNTATSNYGPARKSRDLDSSPRQTKYTEE